MVISLKSVLLLISILTFIMMTYAARSRGRGEALMLVTATDEEGELEVHDHVLRQMFESLSHEVLTRKLAVVSVVGHSTIRDSKFLLWLSVLGHLQYFGKDATSRKMNKNDFSWCDDVDLGEDRRGISVWSEPVLFGNDLAVILLESHGMHEADSRFFSSLVFTLTAQISSLQIYIASDNFPSTHLPDLEYFIKFAKAATKSLETRLFQQLVILATDSTAEHPLGPVIFAFRSLVNWVTPKTYEYGARTGQLLLQTWLKTDGAEGEAMQTLRDSYTKIPTCYWMPHPQKLGSIDNSQANNKIINEEFASQLGKFLRDIIPNNIKPRAHAGKEFRVGDFPIFFKIFADTLIESQMLSKVTLKRQVSESCSVARQMFKTMHFMKFKSLINEATSESELKTSYARETQMTLLKFAMYPVLAGGSGSDCSDQLKKEIDEDFKHVEPLIKEAFSRAPQREVEVYREKDSFLGSVFNFIGFAIKGLFNLVFKPSASMRQLLDALSKLILHMGTRRHYFVN